MIIVIMMMMTMMKILLLKSIKETQEKQLLLRSDHDHDNPPHDPADIMQRAGVIVLYICRSEEGDGDGVREQI